MAKLGKWRSPWALALVVACGGTDGGKAAGPLKSEGSEGGACFPNKTCNAGLSCLSKLCVVATVAGDDASTGGSGGGGKSGGGMAGLADPGRDAGDSGSPSTGRDGGSVLDGGTATTIAGYNESCTPAGAGACVGHAQALPVLCDGIKWTAVSKCSSGSLCDTTPSSAGTCKPVVPECDGRGAGFKFCRGPDSRLACGVDLVTTEDAACPGVTPVCSDGQCTECLNDDRRCSAVGRPQLCAKGSWVDQAACEPGSQQCNGGVCTVKGNCYDVPSTCGSGESCCASSVVDGGTFDRSYDGVTVTPYDLKLPRSRGHRDYAATRAAADRNSNSMGLR